MLQDFRLRFRASLALKIQQQKLLSTTPIQCSETYLLTDMSSSPEECSFRR